MPKTRRASGRFRFQKTIYTELRDIQADFPFFQKEIEAKRDAYVSLLMAALPMTENEQALAHLHFPADA